MKITGTIRPLDENDVYPVTDAKYGIDGLRCFDTITEMYNIPLERRRGGMVVGVNNTASQTTLYYALKPGTSWSLGTPSATDWVPFFSYGTGSSASVAVKNNIVGESVVVPINYEYFVYGNLTIGTGGSLLNYGRTTVANGNIILIGTGTYSNFGTLATVSLSSPSKYSGSFSVAGAGTVSITHGLGTKDVTYSVRDGDDFVYPNVALTGLNTVLLTTTGTVSNGRITIIA